ncbi:MAG: dihydrofolate reductase [Wolbachia endosymbiont of Meromenopon meropis]|nr:dihydrofolate reductase [Wolbachia endosymbiont of Meromenopon meropis]
MIITGIMAIDPKGTIGINNKLPWHYPNDLKHFYQLTDKQVIIMGRKTFETMPKNMLKDRVSIVFSRNKLINSYYNNKDVRCIVISSMREFLSIQSSLNCSKSFMIGGAQIAHLFLKHNLISQFIITKIHKFYKGDVYFDLTLLNRWNETIIVKTKDYTIYRLRR